MQGKRYQLQVKTHTYERIYFIIFNHPIGEKTSSDGRWRDYGV